VVSTHGCSTGQTSQGVSLFFSRFGDLLQAVNFLLSSPDRVMESTHPPDEVPTVGRVKGRLQDGNKEEGDEKMEEIVVSLA
ncbi:hypothetical protein GOODEAATRI_005146, partial [Goodea atripinnis]